jgi:hypothetical protein
MGWRNVAVVPSAKQPPTEFNAPAAQSWFKPPPTPPALNASTADEPPDLTIRIDKPDRNFARGQFAWSFESPHKVNLPPEPLFIDLGDDASTFAKAIVESVQSASSGSVAFKLAGGAKMISDKVPPATWTLLKEIREAVKPNIPTVLLMSSESNVPWELAYVKDPMDKARPPYLGAQYAMGRWILGNPGPPLPPKAKVAIDEMVVVTGDYADSTGLRKLPEAIKEGETLSAKYKAKKLPADLPSMNRLLQQQPSATGPPLSPQAIHFACHGDADPTKPQYNAIILANGDRLDLLYANNATELGERCEPFLFLNACQIGSAGELLGEYAGFAAAFLKCGFRGFVAPLWSVNDKLAHDLAIDFYEQAFQSKRVSDVMRDLRAKFDASANPPPTTFLAYVFYGHPALVLRRNP